MKVLRKQSSIDRSSELDESLVHFKSVIENFMNYASKLLAEIEMACQGAAKKKISLIDCHLDYAHRLCEIKNKT